MRGETTDERDGGTGADGRNLQRGRRRPDRDRTSVHEQPAIERHELPGAIDVADYHEYFHAGRWDGEDSPLRTDDDRDVDWLSSDEWLAYDVDVRESGPYDLRLEVAADGAFGGGEVAVLVDDEPVDGYTVTPTGGWYEWKTLKGRVELPRGVHTVTLAVTEGGWKLDRIAFR